MYSLFITLSHEIIVNKIAFIIPWVDKKVKLKTFFLFQAMQVSFIIYLSVLLMQYILLVHLIASGVFLF